MAGGTGERGLRTSRQARRSRRGVALCDPIGVRVLRTLILSADAWFSGGARGRSDDARSARSVRHDWSASLVGSWSGAPDSPARSRVPTPTTDARQVPALAAFSDIPWQLSGTPPAPRPAPSWDGAWAPRNATHGWRRTRRRFRRSRSSFERRAAASVDRKLRVVDATCSGTGQVCLNRCRSHRRDKGARRRRQTPMTGN